MLQTSNLNVFDNRFGWGGKNLIDWRSVPYAIVLLSQTKVS